MKLHEVYRQVIDRKVMEPVHHVVDVRFHENMFSEHWLVSQGIQDFNTEPLDVTFMIRRRLTAFIQSTA